MVPDDAVQGVAVFANFTPNAINVNEIPGSRGERPHPADRAARRVEAAAHRVGRRRVARNGLGIEELLPGVRRPVRCGHGRTQEGVVLPAPDVAGPRIDEPARRPLRVADVDHGVGRRFEPRPQQRVRLGADPTDLVPTDTEPELYPGLHGVRRAGSGRERVHVDHGDESRLSGRIRKVDGRVGGIDTRTRSARRSTAAPISPCRLATGTCSSSPGSSWAWRVVRWWGPSRNGSTRGANRKWAIRSRRPSAPQRLSNRARRLPGRRAQARSSAPDGDEPAGTGEERPGIESRLRQGGRTGRCSTTGGSNERCALQLPPASSLLVPSGQVVPPQTAPDRWAPVSMAPPRLAPVSVAPARLALLKLARVRTACDRSAPASVAPASERRRTACEWVAEG